MCLYNCKLFEVHHDVSAVHIIYFNKNYYHHIMDRLCLCLSVIPPGAFCAALLRSPTSAFDSTGLRHMAPTSSHGAACGGEHCNSPTYKVGTDVASILNAAE